MREAKKKLERKFFARRRGGAGRWTARGEPFREGDSYAKIRRKPPCFPPPLPTSFARIFSYSGPAFRIPRRRSSDRIRVRTHLPVRYSAGVSLLSNGVALSRCVRFPFSVPRAIRLSVDSKSRHASTEYRASAYP